MSDTSTLQLMQQSVAAWAYRPRMLRPAEFEVSAICACVFTFARVPQQHAANQGGDRDVYHSLQGQTAEMEERSRNWTTNVPVEYVL